MACPAGGWGGVACEVAGDVAEQAGDGVFAVLSHAVASAIAWVLAWTATWWLGASSYSSTASLTLQGWVTPITVLVAIGGVMWQGLMMIVSRRPEPLFQAVRGLWSTALWGAIGVAGTHLVLRASDGFALWTLQQAMGEVTEDGLTRWLTSLLVPAATVPRGVTALVGVLVLLAGFLQALLMFFRESSLVILAGLLQLAASGGSSRATSEWRPKVLAWSLALATYKPMASLIYSVGFLLVGDPKDNDPRSFFMGVTVLMLALLALPLLMKFFSWTTGSLQSASGLGLLATAGAGGLHATASLRTAGGRGVNDYARYLETTLDGAADPAGHVASPPSGARTPPTFQGPAPAPSSSATSASSSGGAAGAGASSATSGAAGGVGAAVTVAQTAGSSARSGANAVGRTMTDPPRGSA